MLERLHGVAKNLQLFLLGGVVVVFNLLHFLFLVVVFFCLFFKVR